jgi:hypothetical protein
MLWFDNDPRVNLETKLERAAAYYRTKYGRTPTLCFVHPSMIPPDPAAPQAVKSPPPVAGENIYQAAGVEVRSIRAVLPNHFWIGINGPGEPGKS